MAIYSFLNAGILLDGLDASGVSNQCNVQLSRAELDVTTFPAAGTTHGGYMSRILGLMDTKVSVSGFVDNSSTPAYESTLSALLGSSAVLSTVAPAGFTYGNVAYSSSNMGGSFATFGKAGEVNPFSLEMAGNSVTCRGTVMKVDAGTSTVTTGSGTATLLGACSASQSVYCQLHMWSVGGTVTPTLTVLVKSSAVVGMTSPTTRASFTARTAVGAQRIIVGPAAITDTYYQVTWTASGTTPTFGFAVMVGVQ